MAADAVEDLAELEFPVPLSPSSILLDDFDTHRWAIDREASSAIPTVTHSAERSTQGSGGLHLNTSMVAAPADLGDNTARIETVLPESEDWSTFDFVTMDIYMAENPTGLAEARLYLTNSAGESAETPLILGWQLFQWENYQMTFPLKGNTYQFAAMPESILSDVTKVGISITRFSDTGFGTPYSELNFTLDNLRLGGEELWDSFDEPKWDWQGPAPDGGITHNQRFDNSASSLRISGEVTGVPLVQRTESSPIGVISAKVKTMSGDESIELELETGDVVSVLDSESNFSLGNDWQTIFWQLRTPVAPSDITEMKFRTRGDSTVYLDDLELIPDASLPADINISNLGGYTTLEWRNPLLSVAEKTQVWARGTEDGTNVMVCETAALTASSSCRHETSDSPVQDYVYLVTSDDAGSSGIAASARGSTIRMQPEDADYAVGFAARNGALQYIQNVNNGVALSTGSYEDNLWSLTFLDETTLPSLRADQFSPDSTTHRFKSSQDPYRLTYEYDEAGRQLELTINVVPIDAQRFELRANITNNTGFAIRAVSLPEHLMFDLNDMERVLFPLQEGMTLLPEFYAENRSTTMARPPMFADVLAYEGERGHLAIHMVQDSRYQAELIAYHPEDEPVFQPNNLGTGGIGDSGYFQFDMVTFIPDGANWESAALRISIDRDFRQVAADYRVDNGIDEYRSLTDKLGGEAEFEQMAKSSILAIEVSKAVEWLKTPEGETWSSIRSDWLDRLPGSGVIHLTHWQKGRDWYDNPLENHKLEDDHPEALPIWWERYGSEEEFEELLNALVESDYLTMPFTNWTVWNTYDPETLDIPSLEETPAAATKLRGAEYPHIEYKGYMVEPWADEVRDRNTRMFDTYTDVYPQDLMFVDMTAERSWRYVGMDDGETASVAAYTQGVINENVRLSEMKPLFTEGVFDRTGNSLTGYAQTLRQKLWNQILVHLGEEYEHWVAYPFAADVLHDKVAFYQHDLNSEVWPGEELEFASYYSLYGYNYMIDVTKHLGEDEDTIWALDAIQQSVNARTFGQPLLSVESLSARYGVEQTTWGVSDNPIEITANFDVDESGLSVSLDGHDIAAGGFLARTARGDMVSGVFDSEFAGAPLTDGLHWITVETGPNSIELQHPIGASTSVRVARPEEWVVDDYISVSYELADSAVVPANAEMMTLLEDGLSVLMPSELAGQPVRRSVVRYGDSPAEWTEEPLAVAPAPDIGAASDMEPPAPEPVPVPEAPVVGPLVDAQSPGSWQTEATIVDSDSNEPSIRWGSPFDAAPEGWVVDNIVMSADRGILSLRVEDQATAYGKVESDSFLIDVARTPILQIDTAGIDTNTAYSVQLQQQTGDYSAFDLRSYVIAPGVVQLDLREYVTAEGENPYRLVFWVSGTGVVALNSVSMSVD